MTGALIVTAALGGTDLAWLDAERRAHFPAERNVLAAHLTMFHALPPSSEDEAKRVLSQMAGEFAPPRASISDVMSLGKGVAYRVRSTELDNMRTMIAEHFCGLLTAQDAGGWRAHVTIQNKVKPAEAKALFEAKKADFKEKPLAIDGLTLNRYLGGPWERLKTFPFRGTARP